MTGAEVPQVSVVMLAFGAEEYLGAAVRAVLESADVEVELILVDNGAAPESMAHLPEDDRIQHLSPGTNLGFTGGVNLGAASARYPTLALVNSDAIVEPSTLSQLCAHLDDPGVGIAGAMILLAETPDLINSAGNPLHVLGLSWAGNMGKPAATLTATRTVASASGACLAIRTSLWQSLGGFPEEYFAYVEDLELSWRCWQRGLRVEILATARAKHYYEFSRSPLKMYLVERNRLLFLLTAHERRTLLWLAPPLLAFELAITVVAIAQGWGSQKVRGWRWILAHRRWVSTRRSIIQRQRSVGDAALVPLITDDFDPAQTPLPSAARPLEGALKLYWRHIARRFIT